MPPFRDGEEWHLLDIDVTESQTNALGHMRAAEYVALFDRANSAFFASSKLTDADLVAGRTSPFLMDLHACYLKEVTAGATVSIAAQHIEHDRTKLRYIMTMRLPATRNVAATCELAIVNMDLDARKPAAWSLAQAEILSRLEAAHASIVVPRQAGRAIRSFSGN